MQQPSAAVLNGHPESPPMTPSCRTQVRYPPQTHQTSSLYKRMGNSKHIHTPPLESITPTGQDYHFNYTRSQSHDLSSPSTLSGQACATTSHDSEDDYDYDSDEESDEEDERPIRIAETANFVIEELDSDPGYDCDIEVIQGHCEDARSEKSGTKSEVLARMKGLYIDDSSDEEERELQERRYRQKKKRWSAGNFKRSHSQSVEGDSSFSDNDPLDDIDPSARRLRRRVRGPIDRRGSLIFEDRGFSNTNNIAEVEEPEEGYVKHTQGPPSIPSDDAFTLDELPFWRGTESMDLEIESE
ncbi:hypothetical protein LEMA_P122310.1 [Plenodomus lingam JN3]|uniref:Uncharacterized protein n=2 Tax=Leptosphaeria maculans TaxID=5022 RepID=E4ZS72_LEPMJ|nr:hypothetical protein LEMA_P122310.1 [Plenodomus lingam JN3]CBX94252.1 hypothetical protein LEMA_P122310.1 [Plenodomus lingam JN3]